MVQLTRAWPSHCYSPIGISCATLTSNRTMAHSTRTITRECCGQKKAHFPFTRRPMNKLPAVNYTAECRSFVAFTGPPISTTVVSPPQDVLFTLPPGAILKHPCFSVRSVRHRTPICLLVCSQPCRLLIYDRIDRCSPSLAASLEIGRESLLLRTPY